VLKVYLITKKYASNKKARVIIKILKNKISLL